MSSISSAAKTTRSPPGGSASVSGIRITMPSSEATAWPSTPYRSRSRALMASAQGAWTGTPYGECSTSRQSPSSSRNRSTSSVESLGRTLVASSCSCR